VLDVTSIEKLPCLDCCSCKTIHTTSYQEAGVGTVCVLIMHSVSQIR